MQIAATTSTDSFYGATQQNNVITVQSPMMVIYIHLSVYFILIKSPDDSHKHTGFS
uniref:Uncharacterized protein n=1 Tax=Arundo donax TaxID=35708 RepID=A0A0A8YNP1_ARUDO